MWQSIVMWKSMYIRIVSQLIGGGGWDKSKTPDEKGIEVD